MSANNPSRLGRYRVISLIGEGSCGIVYHGNDADLQRDVAVKVPNRRLQESPAAVEEFLSEARVLAGLAHTGIVTVFDFGRTDDGTCYMVEQLIAGTNLRDRIREGPVPRAQAVEIVRQVAEALQHAHEHRLVHRDVKPSNILIDGAGRPVLVDFGLALREEDIGTGPHLVGTVLYMSPEQARGEGHRVDARSDIYSLGVIFYELLTGRRPFRAATREETLGLISTQEAPSPRGFDDSMSPDLERICLKAVAFRAVDRYATAREFAEDLKQPSIHNPHPSSLPAGGSVVPRGLRAFDAQDAEVFLGLLPGPRSRDGLPESIASWRQRIESRDPNFTFDVGVLFGPSGSGKSSLVKAGLLPRLGPGVIALRVEASDERTEASLRRLIQQRFPELPVAGLADQLAALRRGHGLPAGQKLLIVLDQFEQFLHGMHAHSDAEMTRALRQCDGLHLQLLLLVRDDFWFATSRFLRSLEVPLVEGHNVAVLDRFDAEHAQRVLTKWGRALGRLPVEPTPLTSAQTDFIAQSIAALGEDGRVTPVRLSLLVEIVKEKPWVPATLRDLGGADGIGEAFLEQTWATAEAAPRSARHRDAARAVLQALLPDSATELKGHGRGRRELQELSGYADQPEAFADLLQHLDQELRLITPVADAAGDFDGQAYQLTHDYLVPALRRWLNRHRRRTFRGRAEIRLAERSDDWNARPQKRRLPGFLDWLSIRLWTRSANWSAAQRKMMASADRHFAITGTIVAMITLCVGSVAFRMQRDYQKERRAAIAQALVTAARTPDAFTRPDIIQEIAQYRDWTVPAMQTLVDDPNTPQIERIRLRMVLLRFDPDQLPVLAQELLQAQPLQVRRAAGELHEYRETLAPYYWTVAEDSRAGAGARLRADCMLAAFDPASSRWKGIGEATVNELLTQPPSTMSHWLAALRPVRGELLPTLREVFLSGKNPDRRALATSILMEYAADNPDLLADLVTRADPNQFRRLFPVLEATGDPASALMRKILDTEPSASASDAEKTALAARKAKAAVALLRLGNHVRVWSLLRHTPTPDIRSHLIRDFALLHADPYTLGSHFRVEPDTSVRRAILLALGDYPDEELGKEPRAAFGRMAAELYQNDPDAGLHAAAGWLIHRHGGDKQLAELDATLAGKPRGERGWNIDRHGHTLVVISGPCEFTMGSPATEDGHEDRESPQHRVRIPRSFAMAAKPVTVTQFERYTQANPTVRFIFNRAISAEPGSPINATSWFSAARYCRWLSEQEGVPEEEMCFPAAEEIRAGMKLPANYLQRTGYRLPTEAEWEYACRAGAVTSHYFGSSVDLLPAYAWYAKNSDGLMGPAGNLKPNDLGLFDMHGNAWQWCMNRYRPYRPAESAPQEDVEEAPLEIAELVDRVLRGGAYNRRERVIRAARRAQNVPTYRDVSVGFRVVRTVR